MGTGVGLSGRAVSGELRLTDGSRRVDSSTERRRHSASYQRDAAGGIAATAGGIRGGVGLGPRRVSDQQMVSGAGRGRGAGSPAQLVGVSGRAGGVITGDDSESRPGSPTRDGVRRVSVEIGDAVGERAESESPASASSAGMSGSLEGGDVVRITGGGTVGGDDE